VPTTPQALAWLAAQHTPSVSSAGPVDRDYVRDRGEGGVGAELRLGSTGEYDGDLVRVTVVRDPDRSLFACTGPGKDYLAGCEQVGRALLTWEAETPEEDPGVINLLLRKGDAAVVVFQAGPAVSRDPRRLDLAVSVDDMVAIAQDPRVDLTTTQESVDEGAAASWWRDPGA
jgi:hypothetical protein